MNDTQHPHGAPYTRATYVHTGCRCDRCKAENAEYIRNQRKRKGTGTAENSQAYSVATTQAARWVRANHPDEWVRILKEAKRRVRASEQI